MSEKIILAEKSWQSGNELAKSFLNSFKPQLPVQNP